MSSPDDSQPGQRLRARGDAQTFQKIVRALALINVPLAAHVAMRIWRMTRRHNTPGRELEWLKGARTEIIHVGNRKVCLRFWGDPDKPTVLLVHGWGGRGSQMAAFAEPLLAAGYSVLAPDLPGHGESDGKYTDFLECSNVLHQLQTTYPHFAAVIAHSFGAVVSTYALRKGLSVDSCVLIGAPVSGEKIFSAYTDWLQAPASVIESMLRVLQKKFGENVFTAMSPGENAAHLRQPCLVVHDEEDWDVLVESGRQLVENWSGAQMLETKGLGHRRILRDANVVQRAVDFISASSSALASNQSRHFSNKGS